MNKKLKMMLYLFLVGVTFITGYLIGNIPSKDSNSLGNQTFYATIESINNNSILVQGLEVNDINYRGKLSFNLNDTIILEWRYTNINLSDLKVGSRISITFNGPVLESYPSQLTNVIKIQLLDDALDKNQDEFEIIDETNQCDTALEFFYEDNNYKYYFNCIRSATTFVKFNDSRKYTIKEAVTSNLVTITDIEEKIKGTKNESIIYKQAK